MTNRIISSLLCAGLGLLLISLPLWIFPVCSAELPIAGRDVTVPMKCFWTARAELGTGLAVMACGLLLLLAKCARVRIGISLAAAILAALAFALPSWLIGVCASEAMLCRSGTLPALQLCSGFLFLCMLINALYLGKTQSK